MTLKELGIYALYAIGMALLVYLANGFKFNVIDYYRLIACVALAKSIIIERELKLMKGEQDAKVCKSR